MMARAPSFPTESLDHHTATAPLVAPDWSLRSTPVDWGSPAPATVPSQAPVQTLTLTPTPFETLRPSLASGSSPTTGPGQPPQPLAGQTGASRDTAAASVTHESLSHHTAPVPLGAPMALRSTPVDWGSPARTQPPMSVPTQTSARSVTAAPSSASARADTQAARSHVPFSTSSAAGTAPSAAVAATEAVAEAAAAPGQQALTDDMPAGDGTHSSGQGRAEGSQASGLQPTGPEGGSRGGMEGSEVSMGAEVQAASTETTGIASLQI